MTIYEYRDYKTFISEKIVQMPRKGYGQARKLAEHIGVHSVVVSQILSGERHFTQEQSLDVAIFFGLDDRATEYFSNLILKARAGTKRLEVHLEKRLEELRKEALDFKNRIPEHKKLSDEDMAIFYSNWFYSGTRLLTSIKGFDNAESIAERLQLSRAKVNTIMEYLTTRGLCQVDDRGRFTAGKTSTFIDAESPFINNLHRNWRLKSLEQMPKRKSNDFFYSAPCSISESDKDAFREEIIKFIGEFAKRLKNSKAEKLACLNLDWFDF